MNSYAYNSESRLILGTNADGETSAYAYNALGARVLHVQTVENPYATTRVHLPEGSRALFGEYLDIFRRDTETWQPAFYNQTGVPDAEAETELTKEYIVDYLSLANRDILVYNEGG